MKRLSDFLYRLIRPNFWIQNYRTDYLYDDLLNGVLGKSEIEIVDKFTVKIDGIEIWVSNYPYAYGHLYHQGDRVLPRPRTRVRLQKMVTIARFKQQLNK